MLNINNLSRPQNVGQAVSNDNNDNNPYNGLNVSNLSKPSDKQESQTISSLYNLLLNNDIIRWDEHGNIKIRSPHGLTTIKKIKFRSFTGDLLPYTNLELPKLHIKLKVVFNDGGYSFCRLIGNNNVYGITPYKLIYNPLNSIPITTPQITDYNDIILEFDKAWSYNNTYDSQIDYNMQEIINYLNNCLQQWFGYNETVYYYGINNNMSFTEFNTQYDVSTKNYGQYITFCNNKIVRIPYINDKKQIDYYVKDMSQSSYINSRATYSAKSGLIMINNTTAEGYHTAFRVSGLNTDKFTTNEWAFRNNQTKFSRVDKNYNPHGFSNNSLIVLPLPTTNSGVLKEDIIIYIYDPSTAIITTYKVDYLTLTTGYFEDVYYMSLLGYSAQEDDDYYYNYLYIGCVKGSVAATSLSCYQCKISIKKSDSVITMTIDRPTNREPQITLDDYYEMRLFELNGGINWDNSYTTYTSGNAVYSQYSGISFIQASVNDTGAIKYVRTNLITENTYNAGATTPKYYGASEKKYEGDVNFANIYSYTGLGTIQSVITNGYYPSASGSKTYHLPLQFIKNTNIESTTDVCDSHIYKGDDDNLYIDNFITGNEFVNFDIYDFASNKPLYTSLMGYPSFNGQLFKYENGILSFPTCVFGQQEFISFVPEITTEPKFFTIKYDIPTTIPAVSSFSTSFINNEAKITFDGINDDVYEKLEVLILLQYEYNDLMLRCSNFPNNDNFVFSINEACEIDFKTMQTNSNNQELNINLTDSNGDVIEYDTLKRLYGKVVLCIDWEG